MLLRQQTACVFGLELVDVHGPAGPVLGNRPEVVGEIPARPGVAEEVRKHHIDVEPPVLVPVRVDARELILGGGKGRPVLADDHADLRWPVVRIRPGRQGTVRPVEARRGQRRARVWCRRRRLWQRGAVHHDGVKGLLERIQHHLPVGARRCLVAGDARAAVERERIELVRHTTQELAQPLRRLGLRVDEHEAVPGVQRHRLEAELAAVGARREVFLAGHVLQLAVVAEHPAVEAAGEAPGVAGFVLRHLVAAMGTDIVKRAQPAVLATGQDQRPAQYFDVHHPIVARIGNVLGPRHLQPGAPEHLLALALEKLAADVGRYRQWTVAHDRHGGRVFGDERLFGGAHVGSPWKRARCAVWRAAGSGPDDGELTTV